MTQAYNLAILANAVDTSGKLNVGTNASGVLPQANGGTGASSLGSVAVTSVSAGSGISVSASTGAVTISASGGGVTSLNGQTGAITDTNFDSIGSYISAIRAINLPGGIGYQQITPGNTIAGSTLRYQYVNHVNYDQTPSSAYGGCNRAFSGYTTYGGGGSSVSGTWRCVSSTKETYNSCDSNSTWSPGLFVRIS